MKSYNIYLKIWSVLDLSSLVEPRDFRQRLSGDDHLKHSLAALWHVESIDWLQEAWRFHLFGQLQGLLRRRR